MNKTKILIVEDQRVTAEDLSQTLKNLGYIVTGMASSAETFYQCIASDMPDIILMDIFLKGERDGIELAAEIRDKYWIPVIFLTAYADIRIIQRAKITEPYAYIVKPYQERELQSSIEMAVYRRKAEGRIRHLNAVLKAVQEVNHIIVRVENEREMIEKACMTLISTRGYVAAWIALTGEDRKITEYASAGLKENSQVFHEELTTGFRPPCMKSVEVGEAAYVIRQVNSGCGKCPLRAAYPEADVLTVRIQYSGHLLGFLSVVTETSLEGNHEEIVLITEISEDFGLALSNLQRLRRKEMAEADSVRARDDWEKTFNAMPDLIAIIDTRHRIVRANKAMAQKLKCAPGDLENCQCFEVLHGLDSVPDFCPHTRSMISRREEHSDVLEPSLGGTYDITTTPLFDEEGNLTGSVHVARDVTSRIKSENDLKKKIEQLEWFNHMMIDRELKMMELKKEVNMLANRLGEEDRYVIHYKEGTK